MSQLMVMSRNSRAPAVALLAGRESHGLFGIGRSETHDQEQGLPGAETLGLWNNGRKEISHLDKENAELFEAE